MKPGRDEGLVGNEGKSFIEENRTEYKLSQNDLQLKQLTATEQLLLENESYSDAVLKIKSTI